MKKIIVFLLLICLSYVSYSQKISNKEIRKKQNKLYKEAQKDYMFGQYMHAKNNFIKLLEVEPSNYRYNYELGLLYFHELHDKPMSVKYFETAKNNPPADGKEDGELYYYLGKAYQFVGRNQDAIAAYEKFLPFIENNEEGFELRNEVNQEMSKCLATRAPSKVDNGYVTVTNLGMAVNSVFSEYAPVIDRKDSLLMFTSRREVNERDGEYYEGLYMSRRENDEFTTAKKFTLDKHVKVKNIEKSVNKLKYHEAVIGLTPFEDKLFIYKQNKLWISHLKNGKWQEPVKIEKDQNFGKVQPHASMTADSSTLYLSMTNKRGANRNLDLYKSIKQTDGSWSLPEKLPEIINSQYDEDSPEISEDGSVLCFASKGHDGFGGYDVFMAVNNNGKWTNAVNLGQPVNSLGDDIYFKLNKKGDKAYFASNRQGGYGEMDIYTAFYNVSLFEDIEPYDNREVKLISLDATGVILDKAYSDLLYSWDMDDGTVKKGIKVEHSYMAPGDYNVKLAVVETSTMKLKYVENDIDVEVDNFTFIGFNSPDTIKVDEPVLFDASPSKVKDGKIIAYNWNFNDNSMDDSLTVYHKFTVPGNYTVQMVVRAMGENDKINAPRRYLVNKEVVVLSEQAYLAYTSLVDSRKAKQQDYLNAKLDSVLEIAYNQQIEIKQPPVNKQGALASSSDTMHEASLQPLKVSVSYSATEHIAMKSEENIIVADAYKPPNVRFNILSPDYFTREIEAPIEDSVIASILAQKNVTEEKKIIAAANKNVKTDTELTAQNIKDKQKDNKEVLPAATDKNKINREREYGLVIKGDTTYTAQNTIKPKENNKQPAAVKTDNEKLNNEVTPTKNTNVTITAQKVEKTSTTTNTKQNKDVVKTNETKTNKVNTGVSGTIAKAHLDTTKMSSVGLEKIYFDFDKYYIKKDAKEVLSAIIAKLKDNPSYNIKVAAFTDARGKKSYNMKLSIKRAYTVKGYLIRNGIAKNRITISYFGEKNLVNECKDGVPCTRQQHQENRRVELNIITHSN